MQQNRENFFCIVLFLITWILFLWMELRGIDFGPHPDEHRILRTVQRAVQTGIFLPQEYYYPSFSFWISVVALTPELTSFTFDVVSRIKAEYLPPVDMAEQYKKITSPQKVSELCAFLSSQEYLFRVRTFYIFITSFSGLWIFLAVILLRKSFLEAYVASLLFFGSFEVAYHARWAMPDTIQLQFSALTLLFLSLAYARPNQTKWWIRAGIISTACACSSKYQGGILLLSVLSMAYWIQRSTSLYVSFFREVFFLFLLFTGTFFLTSPGCFLQPFLFMDHLTLDIALYKIGFGGYTVGKFFEHTQLLLIYLSLSFFSPYWWIALVCFLSSFLGIYAFYREQKGLFLVLFVAPFFYFIYMISNAVMVVRNYLLLVPFLILLVTRGLFFLLSLCCTQKPTRQKAILYSGIFVFFVFNFTWQYQSSESILNKNDKVIHREQIWTFLQTHHLEKKMYLSPRIFSYLKRFFPIETLPNVTSDLLQASHYIIGTSEIDSESWYKWKANRPFTYFYEIVAGPRDINFSYYPSWQANVKAICLPKADAIAMELIK